MATTRERTDHYEILGASHIPLRRTRFDRVKDWFAKVWHTNPVFNLLCCTEAEPYELASLRRRQDHAVSLHMLRSLEHYGNGTSVIEEVLEDMRVDNLNLSTIPTPPSPPQPLGGVAQPPTYITRQQPLLTDGRGLNMYGMASGAPALPQQEPNRRAYDQARFVPRFVVSVVVAVRSRLGMLKMTDANRLLVEREALRLMRAYNVRELDCASHMPAIMRNYFYNDVHYRVATCTSRMTRFERWLSGLSTTQPSFDPLA